MWRPSADPDLGVGDELVRRQRQIGRRRPSADATGSVVLRAVARTEIAAVVALVRERDAAEMGADADQHLPLLVAGLDALLVGLGIRQTRDIDRARLLDLLLAAVVDEDRPAAPEHLDDLTFCDGAEIDFDRRTSRDGGRVRVHLRDQWPYSRSGTDRTHGSSRDVEEVAARWFGRRHRRHVKSSPLSRDGLPARGEPLEYNPEVGERSSRSRSRKGGMARTGWRFIGTLVEGAQVRHGSRDRKLHESQPLRPQLPGVPLARISSGPTTSPGQIQNRI